ncbi:MAG: hypothetical protein NVSMB18_20650 [Acetobacteraceae bacterium]
MAAPLQDQRRVLAGPAAAQAQHALADAADELTKIVVPRSIILRSRFANLIVRGDWTGYQQEHGGTFNDDAHALMLERSSKQAPVPPGERLQ